MTSSVALGPVSRAPPLGPDLDAVALGCHLAAVRESCSHETRSPAEGGRLTRLGPSLAMPSSSTSRPASDGMAH